MHKRWEVTDKIAQLIMKNVHEVKGSNFSQILNKKVRELRSQGHWKPFNAS